MTKIAFVDFHNYAPHLEISFELVKRHIDLGDSVHYSFLGHSLPYKEHLAFSALERSVFSHWQPERQAARLINSPRLTFVGGATIDTTAYTVTVPNSLEELKQWTHDGADLGMGIASTLITGTRNSQVQPSDFPDLVHDAMVSSIAAYEYCKDLFKSLQPDRIYIFNGRLCLPRAALRAAEATGAEIRIHERGANMNRFVVRDYIPHDRVRIQQDIASLWRDVGEDEASRSTARTWYEERRGGSPKDWLSFTSLQESGRLPDLPRGKRIATYFSSSDDEIVAIGEVFGWTGWRDQYDAVSQLVSVASRIEDLQLVIRLHPHLLKKHPADLRRWTQLAHASGTTIVIEPGSQVDSYALIAASDVVVTGGSTIGMEATYWGRPSILLGPSDYDLLGAVNVAYTPESLEAMLTQLPTVGDRDVALAYAYYRATFGEEFLHYEPSSLFAGKFLGRDLQSLPHLPGLISKSREAVLRILRGKPESHQTFG